MLALGTPSCMADNAKNITATKLQIFVEPDAGYQPVTDAINSSKKSILMEMYLLTDKRILGALEQAKARGVDVRIILEKSAFNTPAAFTAITDELNSSGIPYQRGNPDFKYTHEKSFVIDQKAALIMTINQDKTAYSKNREFGIIDSNANDVSEIVAVFENDWNRTTPIIADPNLVWSPVNSRQKITSLIDNAKRRLYVENEEMTDKDIENHLISAAQRGVDVRVVMSPSHIKDDPSMQGIARIKNCGVKVRLLTKPYIHAKIIVADGSKGFVGSENFSPTSLNRNRELGILTSNSRIVRTLSSTFSEDWNAGVGTRSFHKTSSS
jgi:cardiolipin synthase A/B